MKLTNNLTNETLINAYKAQGLDVELYAKREYSSLETLQKCTNLERLQNMKLSSY